MADQREPFCEIVLASVWPLPDSANCRVVKGLRTRRTNIRNDGGSIWAAPPEYGHMRSVASDSRPYPGSAGVRLLVRLSGLALCEREEIAIAGLREGMECFYWASGGPYEYEIEREALHVSTSAASRGHELFAPLQFRWGPPERELSRGWKDDQRTEDETLFEE